MRTKFLLLGAIFAMMSLTAGAQISEMFYQGFESGEAVNYTVSSSSNLATSTTYVSTGSKAVKLVQSDDGAVELQLDVIDFTQDLSLRYVSLYFDHICPIKVKGGVADIATLQFKRENQSESQWQSMSSQEYNKSGSYSDPFTYLGAFNENSYDEWRVDDLPEDVWRTERFDLDNVLNNQVADNERKLQIKFVLAKRNSAVAFDSVHSCWFIDNIRVVASADRMVAPKLVMKKYPYVDAYPNGRGARILFDASTSVTAGLNPDSIYLTYMVGSDTTKHRIYCTQDATSSYYGGIIPFFGYDTVMRFNITVRDATSNENSVTFPTAYGSWREFHYVRGVAQPSLATDAFVTNTMPTTLQESSKPWSPFNYQADGRAQFLYDSALMAGAGYGPGGITSFRMIFSSDLSSALTYKRMQLRMRNVPNDFTVETAGIYQYDFYSDFMDVVYDGEMDFPASLAGDTLTINLQDTFFYSGQQLLMQVWHDDDTDRVTAPKVAHITAPLGAHSIAFSYGNAEYHHNAFVANELEKCDNEEARRPSFLFNAVANMPLYYDAGISELVDPNYDVAMFDRPGSIKVKLKNYGAMPFDKIRISFDIDDTIFGYYDWNSTLLAGADAEVEISNTINIPAGFHRLRVWVEDTLESSSVKYRDHEPLNDTMFSEFIVCDGPLSGVRNIGGENAHFNDIDEFLFSLSRCGIDDSLVVRVAGGNYPAFQMPVVNGLSEDHYIVFEQLDAASRPLVYSDSTTTGSSAIVDLTLVDNVRFRNFDFVRRNAVLTNIALLDEGSENIHFEHCRFIDSLETTLVAERIDALIDNGGANNLTVDSCTLVGGRLGIYLHGASGVKAQDELVMRSAFSNQIECALRAEEVKNLYIDSNQMMDVMGSTFSVLQVSNVEGEVQITANKIYTTHGASGITLTSVTGTATQRAVVANNMLECNDDGTASNTRTLLSLVSGDYVDVVYNSTLFNAPKRANTPSVTFGGGGINNCRFVNNIVASVDAGNYALSYQPSTSTTNTVSHNIYYSKGTVLNRRGTVNCTTLGMWLANEPADTLSYVANPSYLHGSICDLRTFNINIKGKGTPLSTVTHDMFGSERSTLTPCQGAFEFSALPYDFEPVVIVNPLAEDCYMPEQSEFSVLLRNNGVDNYTGSGSLTLSLNWSINGGATSTINVNSTIGAGDSLVVNSGQMVQMPTNGIMDSTYHVQVWTVFGDDPNPTNDTLNATIKSYYHPSAPVGYDDSVEFATITTVDIDEGIVDWPLYDDATAPTVSSKLYWYTDSTSTEPFHTGTSYTTDEMREETYYYVRQKREVPIIRLTQVEIVRTTSAAGRPDVMPAWLNTGRKLAVQLTNVGDYPADLENDTLLLLMNKNSSNGKYYKFGKYTLQPGQSVVMQFAKATTTDSTKTLFTDINDNVNATDNFALVYYQNGQIVDAVAVNDMVAPTGKSATKWDDLNVPSYVWDGDAVGFSSTSAGLVRTGYSGTADDWVLSNDQHPLTFGTVNEDMLRYVDHGCVGDFAVVRIGVIAPPTAELVVGVPMLPEGGCNMGEEEISVNIHNYGSEDVENVEVHYSTGTDVVSETIAGSIASFGDTTYTFTTKCNMAYDRDSLVGVRVWVTKADGDDLNDNDTNIGYVRTRYTPAMPAEMAARSIDYATRDTITLEVTGSVVPIWYDTAMNPIDTTFTHISDILYEDMTFGVSLLNRDTLDVPVGTGEGCNEQTGFPSPYQSVSKYARQQYIYSASELKAAGLRAGNVESLSFYLQALGTGVTSVSLLDYTIKIGTTADTMFYSEGGWKATPFVAVAAHTEVVSSDNTGWVEHVFDEPYEWDGESNIVMEVSYKLQAAVTAGVRTRLSGKTGTSLYKNQNSIISATATGNISNDRPNALFHLTGDGCEGPIREYTVQLLNIPERDAAIFWTEQMDTTFYGSCEDASIPITLVNQGTNSITTASIEYFLDDEDGVVVDIDETLDGGMHKSIGLVNKQLKPGIHSIQVVVTAEGDDVHSNDTLQSDFVVRFCGGTYTVAAADDADYQSPAEAVAVLNEVGVMGAVVFSVADGTYDGNIEIGEVYGTSATNTVTFQGAADEAYLTYQPTVYSNPAIAFDGASYISLKGLHLVSNAGHVVSIANSTNISVQNCHILLRGMKNSTQAVGVVLSGDNQFVNIANNTIDSAFYGVVAQSGNQTSVRVVGNDISEYYHTGILLNGVSNINVLQNHLFVTSALVANRGLTGIFLKNVTDTLRVEQNSVYMVDQSSFGKRGIQLENCFGSTFNPGLVANNMIGLRGNAASGLTPSKSAGLWIDSSSSYVNIFFNTINLFASSSSNSNETGYCLYTGATTNHLQLNSNILANRSYSYVLYVSDVINVSTSNFNAYYSLSNNPYFWGAKITSLSNLQTANSDDGNSVFDEPFFVSDTDLHMLTTNFYGLAQYSQDVPYDFDDVERSQSPGPTIGAHELNRAAHDMSIVQILSPKMPATIATATNVETDNVQVVVTFYNNGTNTETGVQWYAYIEGHEAQTTSAYKTLGSIAPQTTLTDTLQMPTVMGIIDTQVVRVVLVCNGDTVESNNQMSTNFYLAPAFNLAAKNVIYDGGCNVKSAQVRVQIKNEGRKPIPAGTQITIGYKPEVVSPAGVSFANFTGKVEQNVTLSSALAINDTIGFNFTQKANVYPGDTALNINFRIRAWVKYGYDILSNNDTTTLANSPQKPSYYKPAAPFGHDTTLNYGTWGEVVAEQANALKIRWYRDSTATPFYQPNSYNSSTRWSNTPQYFHDSTYYLQCTSDKGCVSNFSKVKVSVAARKQRDMAIEEVLKPTGQRVYMENDTVSIRVANYGTSSQSNVPVVYELWRGTQLLQTVTENIPTSIAAGDDFVYTFNTLLDIPTPTTAQNYTLWAYTDLSNDGARRNDTLRESYSFNSLSVDLYSNYNNYPSSEETRFDITRLTYNGIDIELPVMNRSFTNMADFENPEYPVLHVRRGMVDSLYLQVTPVKADEQRFRCRTTIGIDFNRDGLFSTDSNSACSEVIVADDAFYNDSIYSCRVAIPNCASYGYMRMRVLVTSYAPGSTDGHMIDFLLFVDEDAPAADVSINSLASPLTYLVKNDSPTDVSFRVANAGKVAYDSIYFYYSFVDDYTDSVVVDTLRWEGPLAVGRSATIALPAHSFNLGATQFVVWHEVPGDVNHDNDTLRFEFYRFRTITLTYEDDFDSLNYWYAPAGHSAYSHNYWQKGTPDKVRLSSTASGDNAWVTDLHNMLTTGRRGNVSYLYSPIIDISQIRADSISFRMMRNFLNGAYMQVEYLDFQGRWMKLDVDTATTWYNDAELRVFNGTSALSDGYIRYVISTMGPGGNFPEKLQFRFALYTPMGSNSSSSFGEGCAIDDFRLLRARRQVDAGVVEVVYPMAPRYGQTIYPRLAVKNYGTDTLYNFQVGFTHYGSSLAKVSTFTCILPPDSVEEFTCTAPLVITSDFPESFYFRAFTILPADIYRDNDSIIKLFYLSPLDNDLMAEEVIAPTEKVVAGDSTIQVTIRVRNFGYNDIHTATAGYSINGVNPVYETVDFDALMGGPLPTMEYFNYTFTHKLTAPMGVMNITAWMHGDGDEYIYNDTVSKRVQGIMSVTDIAATAVVLDTSHPSMIRVGMVLENKGTRSVNNFEVGFFIDGDESTKIHESYRQPEPLPALSTGYYLFEYALLPRTTPYDSVTVYAKVVGDNDPSNDTTSTFATMLTDLAVEKIFVEENASPDCRVFMRVRNVGNVAFVNQQLQMKAVINGNDIETNITRRIEPGRSYTLEFDRRIPKSMQRSYVGYGGMKEPVHGDNNPVNDQTSIVELINYMEGINEVATTLFTLGQNRPNPFVDRTTIPFTLVNAADVRLFVVDALGHVLNTIEQQYSAGEHTITIDLSAYPAGVYYYGIEVEGRRQMRKMILH